jgi:hypothetical protein
MQPFLSLSVYNKIDPTIKSERDKATEIIKPRGAAAKSALYNSNNEYETPTNCKHKIHIISPCRSAQRLSIVCLMFL